MVDTFLPKLSQSLLEILEDDEYYDITIEVGNDPHVNIFRAHMNILYYRSPYFRRVLSNNKKKTEKTLTHVKLPNFSPEIFQIILRYIYGGRLPLEGFDDSVKIKTLVIANELGIQDLITYLQSILIENKKNWSDENLNLIYQTSLENNSYLELQEVCTELILNEPEKFFESPYFITIPKKTLISLIQNDHLKMSAVQVWKQVLKWGLAQNKLSSDPSNYSSDDFNKLKGTLEECIPLIKFHRFTSKEFVENIFPYKKIIPEELFDNSVKFLLNNADVLESNSKKVDSFIITNKHVELITKWIEKLEITNEIAASYEFRLLAREQGMLSHAPFHNTCDNMFPTISIIKVKGSDEILGGYNPLAWYSRDIFGINSFYGKTNDSFIFSFKNKDDIDNHILSRVKNEQRATFNCYKCGPAFGYSDLIISPFYGNECIMNDYEKSIRESKYFDVELCEIFLINKK